MSTLLPLIETLSGNAWAFLLVFLRVGAAMSVLPAFGEQMISVRIRLVVALMLTAIVAPAALVQIPFAEKTLPTFLLALATESIAGLFLGFMLRLFVLGIQTAGAIAAQSTSLAQLLGQPQLDPLPAVGNILTLAALALLMVTGFHVKAAGYIIQSYQIIPALSFPNPADIAQAGAKQVSKCFALGFSLAAPFVLLSVLYNLTLGFINKAMPQLMVAMVGAPVITFCAIFFLMIGAPMILTIWLQAVDTFLYAPFL